MRNFLLGFVVGILTLPAGAFAAAWMGCLPTNASATPARSEKAFAHLALDSIVRLAPRMQRKHRRTRIEKVFGFALGGIVRIAMAARAIAFEKLHPCH